jgi:D-amino-acid dehydrogenase
MNYQIDGNARLFRPVADVDQGYALAPIAQGIRLTTGIEFANRDAAPTPIQLRRSEPVARSIFALGRPLHGTPWMGCRPCLADMLPVIGAAPRHPGLWFCFGHGHLGFTLAPVTGRLLAEMMSDETPFADPLPYSPGRFAIPP